MKGALYLLPVPIVEEQIESLSIATIEKTKKIEHFVAERGKTCRRILKHLGHPSQMSEIKVFELDKKDPSLYINEVFDWLDQGFDVGVMSEAGCPGIADPGAHLVQKAHEKGIEVHPYVGPSSILLALMGSGFNGQQFIFHGYTPIKKPNLVSKIKKMELEVNKRGVTQIFFDTPYRNEGLFQTLIDTLNPKSKLCVAINLTSENEILLTKKVQDWRSSNRPEMNKIPAIFLIGK